MLQDRWQNDSSVTPKKLEKKNSVTALFKVVRVSE